MKYFGTDGIRGVYGRTLTDELAYRAGRAAATLKNEWVVASDTRVSCDAIYESLKSGLISGGASVLKVGIAPTPCVSYLSGKRNSGGIMISASHNPPDYNGLKFFIGGAKIGDATQSEIERLIDDQPALNRVGKEVDYSYATAEYVRALVKFGGFLDGRKISLDCAYGAASSVAYEAFTGCGANVKIFCDRCDGAKINCGCGALYPDSIAGLTDDIGFAFDGDADRVVACDGKPLDGDSALYNLALALKPNGVVCSVMSNSALQKALGGVGVSCVRADVGDRRISEAMLKNGFTLGGEQSGHYIISPFKTGDGLLAALILSRQKAFKRLTLTPQKTISLFGRGDVLSNQKFIRVKEQCLRALPNGRLLVRKSGTEEKIRITVECEDDKLLDEIIGVLVAEIKDINKEVL